MTYGVFLRQTWALALIGGCILASPAQAADKARISGLTDVSFGTIAGSADLSASQSLCAYSNSATSGYSVVAVGSGSGGAFELSTGSAQLPYEVLWADAAGQTGGSSLVAGVVLSGLASTATHQSCNVGPNASASLTIVLRAAELDAANAGTYSGTLQLTIAPE